MKVFTQELDTFKPITIVLETKEEAHELLNAISVTVGNEELWELLRHELGVNE